MFYKLEGLVHELYSDPCQACRMESFQETSQGLSVVGCFPDCSVLGAWWSSEYNSGYTGLSVEGLWFFALVAWSAYPHTDSAISFDFTVFFFHTSLLIYSTECGATTLGQRATHHISVYHFWLLNLCLSNIWC